ncbi:eri-1, partial [Symbiodinium sp. KB8]
MNPESDGDEEEKEALLGSASSLELTERRPSESVAEGPVQHHLFAMSLREARSLVEEPPIEEEPRRAEEPGKLVLDPCLGRGEVLCAKARLGLVLIAGVFLILGLGRLGHNWLEMRIAQGAVPPIEAAIVIGVLMPAILISFLCLLEHCEWHYVRTLFPT